ncbi:hypothetical protein BDR26DRAFT_854247 [Obelidium mucronatum]|nr:hypothetical protein BDR26DRAFT_854247 [Obelidium mucronatum]
MTTTFTVTKYIDHDGIEHPTQLKVTLDTPLLKQMFSFVHPRQVHHLRLLSRIFNNFIMTEDFAFKCLKNHIPLSVPSTGDEMGDLRQQLDEMAVTTNKRTSLRYNKPNEFQELFFQWPELYQRVFAMHFFKHTRSIGKVIGFGRGSSLPLLIPHQISELTSLVRLDLGMCGISGHIPHEAITSLVLLEFLDLSRNHLDGEIPQNLGRLKQLKFLDLQDNALTGGIPVGLGELTLLTSLHLNSNKLDSSIPNEIGKLIKLTKVDLSKNSLTGSIPVEMGQLVGLTELRLNNNKLTGGIPEELCKLVQLRSLYLARNSLSGPIPRGVGSLVELRQLVVNHNQLGGEIPRGLQDLENLGLCNLKNNLNFTCSFEFDFAF